MGCSSVWKVLDEMIADFRRRRIDVPSETVGTMKAAKTILKIVQNNPECTENLRRIEQYLETVQIYLVTEGEKRFGQKYADEWLNRINEASRKAPDGEKEQKRFVPGLPRQQTWMRITPSTELSPEKLKALAPEYGLTFTEQANGTLLVSGAEKKMKDFVKKIATEHKPKTGKRH